MVCLPNLRRLTVLSTCLLVFLGEPQWTEEMILKNPEIFRKLVPAPIDQNKTCSASQFTCQETGKCIPSAWVCDGDPDCPNGSDEMHCQNVTCSESQFTCKASQKCIPKSFVCDQEDDCGDRSDEDDCQNKTCAASQFTCQQTGVCIPSSWVCDGQPDCPGGSDENNCQNVTCSQDEFTCNASQKCITKRWVCDREDDCGDRSDEADCQQNICNQDEFTCKAPQGCIPNRWVCDGDVDCTDRSDEAECRDRSDEADRHDHVLLVANRTNIHKLNLETNEGISVATNLRAATGVDYIYSMGLMFWSDVIGEQINSASLSEALSVNNVITTDIQTPDGIAVDWIYEHIYWTDTGKDTIEVSNLQGTSRKTLFDTDLDEPRPIAVDPIVGWMFWADWGEQAKIERAGIDGSHRLALITKDIEWPNGLALDYVDKRMFWVDAKLNTLCSANYDGSARKVVLSDSQTIKHPFGVDVFEDYVYWTDWGNEYVGCVNKNTGDHVRTVNSTAPMDLAVYHPLKQPNGENYCTSMNGTCSDFCFPAPRISPTSPHVSCACPDGKVLANDGRNCVDGVHSQEQ